MRKTLTAIAFFAVALLAGSCHSEYFERIEELKSRADALEQECTAINANIISLQALAKVINSNDLITGVTEIKSDGSVVGYKINFAKTQSITIYDGVNGSIPYIGLRQDGQDLYWTIKYGSGDVEDLTDSDGNKVKAVGAIPILRIDDGYWYISYDKGKSYTQIGQATGDNADSMIKVVNASDTNYVIFYMADGTSIKVPKKAAYDALEEEMLQVNASVKAIKTFIDTNLVRLVYVTKCEPILDGTDSVGTHIELSNGESCDIRDWKGEIIPVIRAEKDTVDNVYYWIVQYGEDPFEWILNSKGEKIRADVDDADIPVADVQMKQSDGNFYWTVTVGDTSYFVKNRKGEDIAATTSGAFAADSVQCKWFKSVTDGTDYLVVVLTDGTTIKLPHQYTVQYSLKSSGAEISGDSFTMTSDRDTLSLNPVGGTLKDIVAITEGRISASVDSAKTSILLVKNEGFSVGSLTVIATFAEANSTNTRMRKFTVN